MGSKKQRLYDLGEAQVLLGGIGRTKLFEELSAGRLKAVHIGRRRLVSQADIDDYVELLRLEAAEAQDDEAV